MYLYVHLLKLLSRAYMINYCFGHQRSYNSLSVGSNVETIVGSARITTRFFGVPRADDPGTVRRGIRIGFEVIVDDVGLPNIDGDCCKGESVDHEKESLSHIRELLSGGVKAQTLPSQKLS